MVLIFHFKIEFFRIFVCNMFQFGAVQNLSSGNGLKYLPNNKSKTSKSIDSTAVVIVLFYFLTKCKIIFGKGIYLAESEQDQSTNRYSLIYLCTLLCSVKFLSVKPNSTSSTFN